MGSPGLVPNSIQGNLKSFWSRPEGKTGMLALAILGGGALFLGWGVIVPFILATLESTFLSVVYGGLTIALLMVLLNHRFQQIVGLSFKLIMRKLTGIIITIDPIGILKENLLKLKEQREKFSEQISSVRGAIQTLTDIIKKNTRDGEIALANAESAKQMALKETDPVRKTNLQNNVMLNTRSAGRLKEANVKYQDLLSRLQTLYVTLGKWDENIGFFIADKEDTVKQAEIQYKTINKTYGAFKTAMSIFKGNADDNDLYNRDLEFLAEDASSKLGQMEDFQRATADFMTSIDVQNGAMSTAALAALDAYEQKALPAPSVDGIPVANQKQAVRVSNPSDYSDFFTQSK